MNTLAVTPLLNSRYRALEPNVRATGQTQLAYVMASLLVLHAAFRGTTADLDSAIYTTWYSEIGNLSFSSFLDRLARSGWMFQSYEDSVTRFEWGFSLLGWAIRATGAPIELFYGIIGALSLYPKVYALTRLCRHPTLGLFWYAGFCYLLLEMNAMRAGLAAGVMVIALIPLLQRRWSVYIGLIVFASTLHISAMVALLLPIFVIWRPTARGVLTLLVGAAIFSQLNLVWLISLLGGTISKIAEYGDAFVKGGTDITYGKLNPFNLSSALFLLAGLFYVGRSTKIDRRTPLDAIGPVLYMLPLIILFGLASFPIFAARLSELTAVYQILVIPRLIEQYRRPAIGRLLLILVPLLQLGIQQYRTYNVDVFYFVGKPRPEMLEFIEQKIIVDAVLGSLWNKISK